MDKCFWDKFWKVQICSFYLFDSYSISNGNVLCVANLIMCKENKHSSYVSSLKSSKVKKKKKTRVKNIKNQRHVVESLKNAKFA